MICTIECFHWVRVVAKPQTTELWFENKVCVTVEGGTVQYDDGQDAGAMTRVKV